MFLFIQGALFLLLLVTNTSEDFIRLSHPIPHPKLFIQIESVPPPHLPCPNPESMWRQGLTVFGSLPRQYILHWRKRMCQLIGMYWLKMNYCLAIFSFWNYITNTLKQRTWYSSVLFSTLDHWYRLPRAIWFLVLSSGLLVNSFPEISHPAMQIATSSIFSSRLLIKNIN